MTAAHDAGPLSAAGFAHRERASSGWVVWLGSGASLAAPSNVPGVTDLLAALFGVLGSPVGQQARRLIRRTMRQVGSAEDLVAQIPFEVAVGEIFRCTRDLVTDFLAGVIPDRGRAQPNATHRAAHALMSDGFADLVITTNFDECLEAAGPWSALVPGGDAFTVNAHNLLKIHGTVSRAETLVATMEAVLRRVRKEWTQSLSAVVAGKRILVLGYGFHDFLDILPALGEARPAAQVYWADLNPSLGSRQIHLPIAERIQADLRNPEGNPLVLLARLRGNELPADAPTASAPASTRAACEAAIGRITADLNITDVERARSLGAICGWLELGSPALRCLRFVQRCDPSSVSGEDLAAALARARRYRRACHEILALTGHDLSPRTKVVHLCQAGHCAASGGMSRTAARCFAHADQLVAEGGLDPAAWPAEAADHYLRGTSENMLRRAFGAFSTGLRLRLLREAEQRSQALLSHEGLPPLQQALIYRNLARIDLLRGDTAGALARIEEQALPFAQYWGEPDAETTMLRLAVSAGGSHWRPRLRSTLARCAREGRWLECLKIASTLAGVTEYRRAGPAIWHLRNWLIAVWDFSKEAALTALESAILSKTANLDSREVG